MQRMGDLVLTFPLLGWLSTAFPEHPLWVVGEKTFYEPLLDLSPSATYFTYDLAPNLEATRFSLVINLSHRQPAALLAGKARCDMRVGPWLDDDGNLFINGDWQIYRTSLTQNNHYNLYHWADLNALDVISTQGMLRTAWPPLRPPQAQKSEGARIGLFLGASVPEKHPDAAFWAALASRLMRAGHKPVLLGGNMEAELGGTVAHLLRSPALNLCGRFSVRELAEFIHELDLLITPDTGPMHLAAWQGTPVLNLSLGPVSAWETGPSAPGHHVLRAALDCVGCWTCSRGQRQLCREALTPSAVAAVVSDLLAGKEPGPGDYGGRVELLRTARGQHGLYDMRTLTQTGSPVRLAVSRFWQAWFGKAFGRFSAEEAAAARTALAAEYPDIAEELRRNAATMVLFLARGFRGNAGSLVEEGEFWRSSSPLVHPFAGFAQMYIQNASGSSQALTRVLAMAEELAS